MLIRHLVQDQYEVLNWLEYLYKNICLCKHIMLQKQLINNYNMHSVLLMNTTFKGTYTLGIYVTYKVVQ